MSKPFDLAAAKAGAPVTTRSGRPVRLFCFDLKSTLFPIGGAIELPRVEEMATWNENGKYVRANSEHDFDLVMAPRKVVKWMAISSEWASSVLCDSEEEAHRAKPGIFGIVARVEWKE